MPSMMAIGLNWSGVDGWATLGTGLIQAFFHARGSFWAMRMTLMRVARPKARVPLRARRTLGPMASRPVALRDLTCFSCFWMVKGLARASGGTGSGAPATMALTQARSSSVSV